MSAFTSSGFSPFRSSIVPNRPPVSQPLVAQPSNSTAALPQAEIHAVDPNGSTCLKASDPWVLNLAKNGGTVAESLGEGVNSVTSKFADGVEMTGYVAKGLDAVNVVAKTVNSPNPGYTALTEGSGAVAGVACAADGWAAGSAAGLEGGCAIGALADGVGCIPGAAIGYLGGGIVGSLGLGYGCDKAVSYGVEKGYEAVTGESCPSGWVPVKNSAMFPPVDTQTQNPFSPMLTPVPSMTSSLVAQSEFSGGPIATPTPTPAPVAGPVPTVYEPSTAFQGSVGGSCQSSTLPLWMDQQSQSAGSFDNGLGDASPACFDPTSSSSDDMGSNFSGDFGGDCE